MRGRRRRSQFGGRPAGRIIQNGPGSLTFTSAASCADTIVYNGGTLSLNMTGTNFSGGLDLAAPLLLPVGASSTVSGGTLAYSPLGVGALILSNGTLQDDGGGRTLANAVTIDGNVTLASAGSTGVSFSPLGLSTPNVVTMNNSPTITVTAPTTIGDQIVGTSGFTMCGPSVLTLTAPANNNMGGSLTVSGGTLQGTAASMATPIVLANNANVTYLQTTDGTLSLPVRGAGSVIKTGAGVLTLGAPSFYQGPTTISAGTLRLPASAANAGLVVRYTMDGPLGAVADGTTFVDLGFSPNGNNGTMVGSYANRVPGSSARASSSTASSTSRRRTRLRSTSTRGQPPFGSTWTRPWATPKSSTRETAPSAAVMVATSSTTPATANSTARSPMLPAAGSACPPTPSRRRLATAGT